MSILTKVRDAGIRLKALLPQQMHFPGQAFVWFDLDRPSDNTMAREVGDGTSSDVLMTPVRWLQRAIVEAPFVAQDRDGEPLENSELVALLNTPNPSYSLEVLLAGTAMSLALDGNAYWIVTRSENGRPVELWYVPHVNVTPKWPSNGTEFIAYYEYDSGTNKQRLKLEDVIHFREGIDPSNLRKGLSPLKGLLREIWTDNEAAMFTAALLKNNGIPGLVVSPADKEITLTPDEGKAAEEKINAKLTRANRGKPLVMLGATNVEQFGFSPKQMDLSPLRDVSEERVTAALGVPAAVVGFGAGLQSTRVGATMKELRQLAWLNGVIPMQRIIAGEIGRSLGGAFKADFVAFDNSNVEALRENQDLKAARVERLYRGGILTRAEARTAMGFGSVPTDEVYMHNVVAFGLIPQGVQGPTGAEAASTDGGNGNGNGNGNDPKMHATLLKALKDHEHDATERRIVAAAPRATPPAVAVRMARRLDIIRRRAPEILQARIEDAFRVLGESAEAAARSVLGDVEQVADSESSEKKMGELAPGDSEVLEQLMDAIDVDAAARAFQEAMEAGYLEVSVLVSDGISTTFGAEFVLDDAAQQNVMRAGGLNAGLIDLDAQTRDALFDALASGRADGLAGENLARHIREHIEAGPWGDVATRARAIARTEGANAANVSTLEAARSMDETEHVQVFDDRMGFGDEGCVAANGVVVTIDEADAMGLAHPNCSRSFVPINALLMEEMGL